MERRKPAKKHLKRQPFSDRKENVKMNKLKKDAEKEFRKLSKKEQDRINRLKRIPVPAPGTVFDKKKNAPRKKKWDETEE